MERGISYDADGVHTRGGKAGAGTNLRRVAMLTELGASATRRPRASCDAACDPRCAEVP